jgi:hypothetical protein
MMTDGTYRLRLICNFFYVMMNKTTTTNKLFLSSLAWSLALALPESAVRGVGFPSHFLLPPRRACEDSGQLVAVVEEGDAGLDRVLDLRNPGMSQSQRQRVTNVEPVSWASICP